MSEIWIILLGLKEFWKSHLQKNQYDFLLNAF